MSSELTLSSGAKFPLVGLGTWKAEKGVVKTVIEKALKLGYRHIDCAADYGNETEVGEGIQSGLAASGLKREDIFVTSKLWNTYHKRENVRKACEKTLSDLGLKYLDLYLIHFPISLKYVPIEKRYPPGWLFEDAEPSFPFTLTIEPTTIRETWEAMEELVQLGLVKNIGVSNFNCALLMDLLKYAKIPPAVNQIELHPYLQQSQLVNFCQKNNIAVTAFSPFGALSYVELFPAAKTTPSLLSHEVVVKIAQKHKRSPAQVLLRLWTQHNVAVIPKSVNEERLKENLHSNDFQLDQEDLDALKPLDKNLRFNNPGVYANCPIFD